MKGRRVKQKVAELLDAPISVISGSFIEIFSNSQAAIEGCKGILEYNESCIKLECSDLLITFKGRGLYIRTMSDSNAMVCGTIASIDFCTK